jgi:membrane carboxypeptidase/penicillin-binding protein PbpC
MILSHGSDLFPLGVHVYSYPSAQKIAWKTGTSFGSRDACAIGVTPDSWFVCGWEMRMAKVGRD